LQAGQDRRQLVPALERETNLFDGCELQIGLGLESVAHDGECCGLRHRNPRIHSITPQTFAPAHPHQTQWLRRGHAFNARHYLGSVTDAFATQSGTADILLIAVNLYLLAGSFASHFLAEKLKAINGVGKDSGLQCS